MGIHNRDYFRGDVPPSAYSASRSDNWAIKWIIISCVVIFFGQNAFGQVNRFGQLSGGLTEAFKLHWEGLRGFEVWRLVTYGFCHADFHHIFFNLLGLWILGRHVEASIGSRETMYFFLVTVVISGLVEVGVGAGIGNSISVIGASGGTVGVVVLAAMLFPRMPMQFFLIPITFELKWLAIGYVAMDVFGALSPGGNVANLAHLAGAACGVIYHMQGIRFASRYGSRPFRFGNWLHAIKRGLANRPMKSKQVRIYEPPASPHSSPSPSLDSEVDRLLDKINREGKASLTSEENELLLKASEIKARELGSS